MALKETTGNILEIGDRVKINLPALEKEVEEYGGDGIEFTATGKNYLRYAREHPDEVYTIVDFDFAYESCPYVLSGYMSDNSWESAHLILIPAPKSRFEVIKNMTLEEMTTQLLPLICELCEDGIPCTEAVQGWLESMPEEEQDEPTFVSRTET